MNLREGLADLCHKQWSGWMGYLFSKGNFNDDGSWVMPAEYVDRWQLQAVTPYAELSEPERDSDRKEADKFIELLEECGVVLVETEHKEKEEKKQTGNPEYNIHLSDRELAEISLCLSYVTGSNHGTVGHNRMNIIAKLAFALFRSSGQEGPIWGELDPAFWTRHTDIIDEG